MPSSRRPNLVSGLYDKQSRPSQHRRAWFVLWLGAVVVAAGASLLISDRTIRGITLVALLFLAIGGIIAWLAGRANRLSSSDREMKDYVSPP